MRHGKKFNHLGRKSAHRKAMLANMASSLILNKRVQTTTAKAKALRIYIEPLITKAKDDKTHSRRIVFKYLKNKEAVSELFRDVAERVSERPGGYTRILKTGTRVGDNAEMCFIELVDYNENYTTSSETKSKTSKRRRRRGGSGKKKTETQQQTDVIESEVPEKEEEPKQEQAQAAETETKEQHNEKSEQESAEKDETGKKEEKEEEPKAEEKRNKESDKKTGDDNKEKE